jgi:nucleotidyltransferase/DNA polymerase involved in DNA repair
VKKKANKQVKNADYSLDRGQDESQVSTDAVKKRKTSAAIRNGSHPKD